MKIEIPFVYDNELQIYEYLFEPEKFHAYRDDLAETFSTLTTVTNYKIRLSSGVGLSDNVVRCNLGNA